MSTEYGRVYSVETRKAGANLEGDHASTATELAVIFGWDFAEEGGQAEVEGVTVTYTSADFPPDDDDDVPVVLHLDAALGVDVADGAFVRVLPGGEDKVATIEVTGQGEPVVADVDHALVDKLPDGIRGDETEAETVLVSQDAFGSWRVVDVPGRQPVVDGGYIDPATLPPSPPPEPVAPTEAPVVTLEPLGLGSLRISWVPIENPTSVDYRAYLGTSSGNVGDGLPTYLVEETKASSVITSIDPVTEAALLSGTNYYAAVRPTSGGLLGPISTVAGPAQIVTGVDQADLDALQGQLDTLNNTTLPALQSEVDDILPITETDISDDAISTPKLQAGSVIADKIGANEVVAGKIAADAVTANEIAADAVTANELAAESVTADAIAANSVNAEHISANSIDGEKLTGTLILGSDITTATEGERHGLSASEGHYSYGPDGQLVFSAKGGNASFTGDVTATSLNVTEGATWAGSNIGASSASTMMAAGIAAPGSPPNIEWTYDEITLDGGDVAGDDQSNRYGLVWHNSHWWVGSRTPGDATGVLVEFDSAGTYVATHSHSNPDPVLVNSLAMLGGKFHGFAAYSSDSDVLVWNGDGTSDGTFSLTQPPGGVGIGFLNGSLGSDGTNLMLAWKEDDGMRWQKYDTSGNLVGGVVNSGEPVTPNAVLGGTFDFGGSRVVVAGPNTASVYSTSGTGDHDFRFTSENTRGLAWDGTRFAGLHSPTKIRLHTNELLGEGVLPELQTAATWRNTTSSYETEASRRGKRGFAQRARHVAMLPVPCPGAGGIADPDSARFYVGRSTGRTKLELIADETALVPGEFASAELTQLEDVPTGTADALNPPPVSGNFPEATPYDHFSQAVIPGTTDSQTSLKGDGSVVLYGYTFPWVCYRRATDISIPNSSATRYTMGTAVETHPYITYSGANDEWTVSHAGTYRITAQARWNGGTSGHRTMNVWVDGATPENIITASVAPGSRATTEGARLVRLAAGAVVYVEAFQNTGASVQITGGNGETFITIERVGA